LPDGNNCEVDAVELFELFFFGATALSAFFIPDFVVVLETPLA